jgi:hypothetical protein
MLTKSQELSRRILDRASEVAARDGISYRDSIGEAINHVCGAGSYEKLVGDLYAELRAAR